MNTELQNVAGIAQGALYELKVQGPSALLKKRWNHVHMQFVLDEMHVWYELQLDKPRPRPPLPPGMRLVRAGVEDLGVLRRLPNVSDVTARRRLAGPNDLWFVLDGDDLAFACWIFRESAETAAAPGGRISLPPGVVFLEDSITSPAYRGRRVAPAAWAAIGDSLAESGFTSMVTKVEDTNTAVKMAMIKSGIRELATVRCTRKGPLRRCAVQPAPDADARWLTSQLVCG